jgi:serine protease Do
MSESTNQLVARGKKFAVPAATAGAFALGAALFVGHGGVHAAMSTAAAPLDEQSVNSLTSLDKAMEEVASRVTPAVVNIAVTSRPTEQEASEEGEQQQQVPPGFEQFFGGGRGQQQQRPQLQHGIGSGVIVSPDGYIVTNNHVVDGATQIKVTLHDRRVLTGKVVGVDKLNDLAVVKVDAKDLPAIAWGDSAKLEPGQTVLAFGSPFGYFQFSVTRGIVSAVNRPNPYSDDARKPGAYIQTDAAINPGNSGGALVNAHGELVGINTFIISDSGSFAGAGFAIPSQIVRATAEQLIKNGKVDHGYLGISMNDVTPENAHFFNLQDASGAVVAQVTPDSPASKAGLQQGDVITKLNGETLANGSALQVAVSEMTPGTKAQLGIVREGKSMTLDLTVGEFHNNKEVASNDGDGQQKGKIGVGIADLTSDVRQQINAPNSLKGAVIEQVRPGSPAEEAGLQAGDVVLEVNRHATSSAEAFANAVRQNADGKDLLLLVWSKGNASYRTVHPEDQNG